MKKAIKMLAMPFCMASLTLSSSCMQKLTPSKTDPYEKFNRVVFAFNQDIDHLIYRPVAIVYHTILPTPLQIGISNALDNIGELITLPNDLLQGKLKYVALDFWRFFINTTFGLAGLFDVASLLGLKKHYNDFGMTLAYWSGGRDSPYLQLPFLGPSTFRDGLGLISDYFTSPYPYIRPNALSYYLHATRLISIRAHLLSTDKLIDQAFDPYIFVRNAYLQHRRAMIATNNQGDTVNTPWTFHEGSR